MSTTKIGRAPLGLQSLFSTQALGANPNELELAVRPVAPIKPFLDIDRYREFYSTATITSRGNTNVVTVPVGEMWQPLFVTLYWAGADAVNDQLQMSVSYDNYPGQTDVTIPTQFFETRWRTAVAIGELQSSSFFFPSETMLLVAGAQFRWTVSHYISGGGSASETVVMKGCYIRYRV